MRQKTYLSPEYQWYLTVELVMNHPHFNGIRLRRGYRDHPGYQHDVCLGRGLFLGRIVLPHRLFVPGDLVLVRIANGAGERQPVWAVSSKGYTVQDYYLQYARYWTSIKGKKKQEIELLHQEAGPLRFVELPDDLVDLQPDDPAIWQFVATLRAGSAVAG